MTLPNGTTLAGLTDLLPEEYPALRPYMRFLHLTVNRANNVDPQTELQDGDQIACIPPVSGG